MRDGAATYGDLLESRYDLRRRLLYESVTWSLPQTPAEAPQLGRTLTECLWRGSDDTSPTFATAISSSWGGWSRAGPGWGRSSGLGCG